MTSIGINAQTTGTVSSIQPLKANGYISWSETPASDYKVNVYLIRLNSKPQLISTTRCANNYFRFSSEQLTSSDLYYTIAEYNSSGILISESNPAAIGDTPPPSPVCIIDCNGLRESYRLSLMEKSNGTRFLMASDDAGNDDPSTGQHTPYYQAISNESYVQFDPLHPYRFATATSSGLVYARDHILINENTPGGPYYDAQNEVVLLGWLVEKKMDKYIHFNGTNTGNYQSSYDWCEANIGVASSIFNAHMDESTLPSIINPATSDQHWFVGLPIDTIIQDTNGNDKDTTIYHIPHQLTCSTNYGGWVGGTVTEYDDLVEQMVDCFQIVGTDSMIIACITGVGNGFGGTVDGFTFESINSLVRFSATFGNENGRVVLKEVNGKFSPGLYRINLFLKNGLIIPKYQELGVPSITARVVAINIVPNPIVNSRLEFNISSNWNVAANLVVRKLDGTIIQSESVNLTAQTPLSRAIPISGTIPYKQVIVSVELPDGTVIQETALTE